MAFDNLTIVRYLISWNDDPTHKREDFLNPDASEGKICVACGRSCTCAQSYRYLDEEEKYALMTQNCRADYVTHEYEIICVDYEKVKRVKCVEIENFHIMRE